MPEKENIMTRANTEIYKCQKCRDIKYLFVDEFIEGYGHREVAKPCPECNMTVIASDQRNRAGIPQKYFDTYFPDFMWNLYKSDVSTIKQFTADFVNSYRMWREKRMGVYIWSKERGSGKTMLASSIMNSLMSTEGVAARFTSVPNYLGILQDAFKKKAEETDHSKQYFDCDILCLDDLGAEKQSEWANQELFKLIDYRYTKGKLIVVTSNIPIKDLECDSRVIDRLNEMCMQIHMPEEGIRALRANDKKQKFADSIRQRYQ